MGRRTSAVKHATAQVHALPGVLSGRTAKLTEAHYQQAITIALGLNIPNRSSHRGPTPETRLNLLRTDSNRIDAINPHFKTLVSAQKRSVSKRCQLAAQVQPQKMLLMNWTAPPLTPSAHQLQSRYRNLLARYRNLLEQPRYRNEPR